MSGVTSRTIVTVHTPYTNHPRGLYAMHESWVNPTEIFELDGSGAEDILRLSQRGRNDYPARSVYDLWSVDCELDQTQAACLSMARSELKTFRNSTYLSQP